ncbi:hypothetical protein WT83_16690 [Burkholderia territorii]|uniref:Transposase n=1 Tax=Burkholderia territorii TaxID=1503055 RepID=A0A108ENR5_9BURK|nr:hypothetical protein WT83_16690 [Burkholderia territorii]
MRKREDGPEVFQNAAGIDIGGSSHWVAVPRGAAEEPIREFGTMMDDLHAMADWLPACGVVTVVLESTGVYWIVRRESRLIRCFTAESGGRKPGVPSPVVYRCMRRW